MSLPEEVPEALPPVVEVFEGAVDREATERARRAAAPIAADVEAIGLLEPATRLALFAVLSSIADNKYVLGRRYAEWCTGAPVLEAAVAAAAMAQDEIGHARSFYPLLRGFSETSAAVVMEQEGWQTHVAVCMPCIGQPFASWSEFVAANLVVDTAMTTLLEAAADAPYEPLRQRARKIVSEEEPHWVHADGWRRRLDGDANLGTAIPRMLADAVAWLDSADVVHLHRAGLLSRSPAQLCAQLQSMVGRQA